jgi:uncharacterized protein (DUF4415 family)
MRTYIEIDDALMAEAQKACQCATKKQIAEQALRFNGQIATAIRGRRGLRQIPLVGQPRPESQEAPGRLPQEKGECMKKGASKPLTSKQLKELTALAALPDDAIDTSDAPELLDWSGAKRGLFYRPVKQQLTLRVDADVVAWFKAHATPEQGYQTQINRALREYVQGKAHKRGQSKRA